MGRPKKNKQPPQIGYQPSQDSVDLTEPPDTGSGIAFIQNGSNIDISGVINASEVNTTIDAKDIASAILDYAIENAKRKDHISRQTLEEFNKKKAKIISFIESPIIKQKFQLGYIEIDNDMLNVYQGNRGNSFAIFKKGKYDIFLKQSFKKVLVGLLGKSVLDLEDDNNL